MFPFAILWLLFRILALFRFVHFRICGCVHVCIIVRVIFGLGLSLIQVPISNC
ncbi:uncharacterized protein BDZ99DRAFT_464767 [Mytilinidion resinicola]|uniref:Uncharacterized protein n=1 Tax=Mytilinidion resinicola TaxID=574789 RepID=A0A6A6YGD0_9PEZI|nr:uncharacterized protein BDZ99DRAFT_464767 [Mytilinidion resinicola]KAF2807862.1 hypothetical protein BDZ99DRAFT_464767 [Mytilinidion resinicola]